MKDPKNVWKIFISSLVMVATSLIEDQTGNNYRAFQMLGLISTNVRTQNCKRVYEAIGRWWFTENEQ